MKQAYESVGLVRDHELFKVIPKPFDALLSLLGGRPLLQSRGDVIWSFRIALSKLFNVDYHFLVLLFGSSFRVLARGEERSLMSYRLHELVLLLMQVLLIPKLLLVLLSSPSDLILILLFLPVLSLFYLIIWDFIHLVIEHLHWSLSIFLTDSGTFILSRHWSRFPFLFVLPSFHLLLSLSLRSYWLIHCFLRLLLLHLFFF